MGRGNVGEKGREKIKRACKAMSPRGVPLERPSQTDQMRMWAHMLFVTFSRGVAF